MPAGQKSSKLLAPRGGGFNRLDNQALTDSLEAGLEQPEHGFPRPAAHAHRVAGRLIRSCMPIRAHRIARTTVTSRIGASCPNLGGLHSPVSK